MILIKDFWLIINFVKFYYELIGGYDDSLILVVFCRVIVFVMLSLMLILEVIKFFVKFEFLWSYVLEIEYLEGLSIIVCIIYIYLLVNVVGVIELVGKDM